MVSKTAALKAAAVLLPEYQKAGVYPVFIVWQTGFLETLTNRLRQVWNESIFDALVKRLLPHVVGALRLPGGPRPKGTAAVRPDDLQVADEYDKRKQNQEPFAQAPRRTLGKWRRSRLRNAGSSRLSWKATRNFKGPPKRPCGSGPPETRRPSA